MKKLELGRVVATPGALSALSGAQIQLCLQRHERGDWGNVCEEDAELNNQAVEGDDRVHSAYDMEGTRLWVITEGRPHPSDTITTVLLPGEY